MHTKMGILSLRPVAAITFRCRAKMLLFNLILILFVVYCNMLFTCLTLCLIMHCCRTSKVIQLDMLWIPSRRTNEHSGFDLYVNTPYKSQSNQPLLSWLWLHHQVSNDVHGRPWYSIINTSISRCCCITAALRRFNIIVLLSESDKHNSIQNGY